MEKEFIPYEQALALKELGFNEPCLAKYTVVPEDGIDWFMIPEQGIANTRYGSSKNYNTKIFEKEGTISAPTFSQAFRWFREKYDLHPSIESYNQDENGNDIEYTYTYCVVTNKNLPKEWNKFYNTYEEAELECLKKLIEIVKEK